MAEEALFSTKIEVNIKQAQSSLMTLENKLVKAREKTKSLQEEIKKYENSSLKSEYEALVHELEFQLERRKEIEDDIKSRMNDANDTTSDDEWSILSDDIDRADEKIELLQQEMARVEKEAEKEAESYGKVKANLQACVNEQAILNQKIKEADSKVRKLSFEKFKASLKGVSTGIKGLAGGIMDKFRNRLNKVKQTASKAGASLKSMILAGLGIRTLTAVARKLVAFAQEGLKNMAQYSSEYNSTMSDLVSATATLKNSLAAVAEPILNLVVPALTSVINYITEACNKVAEFMAIWSGKKTYTKAKQQVIDYAKTVEEAQNRLASFDDLNVLSQDKKGGEATGANAFEEVEVTGSTFVDALKDAFANGDWASIGHMFGEKLSNVINSFDLSSLSGKVSSFVRSAYQLIYGAIEGIDWVGLGQNIGKFIKDIDWAGILSDSWHFVGSVIGGGLGLIYGALKAMFSDAITNIANWWRESAFDENGNFDLIGLFDAIGKKLGDLWQWLIDHIYNPLAEGFVNAFGMDNLGEAVTAFESVGVALENVFISLWNSLKTIINKCIEKVEEMVNEGIDGINVLREVVGKAPLEHISLGRLEMTDLAYVSHATSPHVNSQWIGDGAMATNQHRYEAMYEAMGGSTPASAVNHITLQLDGKVLGKATLPYIEKASSNRGVSLVATNHGGSRGKF